MELLDFFQPSTIEEIKIIISENPNIRLLAGGTDLVLEIRRSKENIDYIMNLGNVAELKCISENEREVVLGSMTTFTDLLESNVIKNNFNSLIECSKHMGSPQIRNVATIGGNIVNAGSAADVIPCIMSLNGVLVIEALTDIRKISCEEYFRNYSTEKIKNHELLTKIIIPKNNSCSGYYKLGKRNALAIARISAAICLETLDGQVKNVNICLGAVGRYPFRLIELEKAAVDKEVNWLVSEEALRYIEHAVEESIKGRKTMPFKKEAIKGVFKNALSLALEK